MAEEEILTDDFLRQLINVGEVDILVGLATHNNAKTIGPVVQAIQTGALKAFSRERVVIINADGGSRDGTPELITGASISDIRRTSNVHALRTLHSITTQYSGTAEPESALRIILAAAELLRAKACAIISPDTLSPDPTVIDKLIRPIYASEADLVTPVYRRHKFEGLLMSNLIYPMTRAMYGKKIREPYSSDFGFSGRLGCSLLRQETWGQEVGRTSGQMLLTLSALNSEYKIRQTFLGDKTQASHSAEDLVPAIRRTVGALFWSLDSNFSQWSGITASEDLPPDGVKSEVTLDTVRINRKRLYEMFRSGVAELTPVLNSILSAETLTELQAIAALPETGCRYPSDLWVKTIYEFAASYHQAVINRDHIIQALAPLYRGRIFSFITENRDASAEEFENRVELLCQDFEQLKPYLLEIWNGRK